MKKKFSTIYAVICTLLLIAGFIGVFLFALKGEVSDLIKCLLGLIAGLILAPSLHELGHIFFAKAQDMRVVYVKFFCFKWVRKDKKLHFSFASPFSPDVTQVIPNKSGKMQTRAKKYTIGGLVFSGIFIMLIIAFAVIVSSFIKTEFALWGMIPYSLYLFLLNVAPLEYASGKTDALVYEGIRKGYDTEKVMISAMEIQGLLSEGKSFSEIDEKLYYDTPVLCEEEPLFLVLTDLRYRYRLEKGDLELAGKELNRLASLEEYMSFEEKQKTAVELTYMHAVAGDIENAEKNAKFCREYLQNGEASCKRALLAYAVATGKIEESKILFAQAEESLEKEDILGVWKFEKILLTRLQAE